MFIIIQSTQFWYEHTMHLHVLRVAAYCGHHQVRKAFIVTFLPSAIPPYTGQCLHIGSALCRYVVLYVLPLCYKVYSILEFLKIF
jgi:hypothetical protein